MINDVTLRERLNDLADQAADQAPPAHLLIATALRQARRRHRRALVGVAGGAVLALAVPLIALGGLCAETTTEPRVGGPLRTRSCRHPLPVT